MNDEAAVVMAFFTFRVFLVGAIFFAFPRISRKGLMFGTYLGEERAEETRRELLRGWDKGCALIMLVALTVGWSIGFTGRWVPGNLIGTVVLLVPLLPLYVRMYRKARGLAPSDSARQAKRSAASLELDETRGDGLAKVAIGFCLVSALALFTYSVLAYGALPERIPTLANIWGYGDQVVEKSLVTVILLPSFALVLPPAFAGMALLIAHAKRSLRSGEGGRSAQAQDTFRVAVSHMFAGTGLATSLLLTVVSIEMIRIWQGEPASLGSAVAWAAGATVLYMGFSLVRIMRLGQGGARLESGSTAAPLAGGLADNARWILGVMYVDRTDPAVMVESRFGIGYTMNLGNRTAQVLLGTYLAALLGLMLLTLIEIGLFS